MTGDDEFTSGSFGDSSKLTNWILDSVATCHMTPEVSYFIPGLLEDIGKHIEVGDGHHVTAKQAGQVRIKCVAITEILSSQRYTKYFWHQIYVAGYFQSLR